MDFHRQVVSEPTPKILGYVMMRYGYPVWPMVLAQILGAMMESNFRRSLAMSPGDPSILVTRPIAVTILILAIFTIVTAIRRQRRALRQQAEMAMAAPGDSGRG